MPVLPLGIAAPLDPALPIPLVAVLAAIEPALGGVPTVEVFEVLDGADVLGALAALGVELSVAAVPTGVSLWPGAVLEEPPRHR